jgi:hypothetical protein
MSDEIPPPQIAEDAIGKITRVETKPFISRNLADFGTPGVWVEVEPNIAEEMGAFEETAVAAADAEDDDGN